MKHLAALFLLGVVSGAAAQDVLDFTEIRRPSRPLAAYGMLRLGGLYAFPDHTDGTRDEEEEFYYDASVYYMTDSFLDKESSFVFYGGREGVYMATGNDAFNSKGVRTRIEAWYRPWSLYREGFYEGDEFIPTLRYRGKEYRVRMGLLMPVNTTGSIHAEAAAYWGRNEFTRSDQTRPQSTVPDDYQVTGIRISMEGGEIAYDRFTNLPIGGAKVTLWGERELNDSDDFFGTVGWQSRLPDKFWRAGGLLSWYKQLAPEAHTLVVRARGRWYDEEDRVHIFDATFPAGRQMVDLNVGWRWEWSRSFYLQPFLMGQYLKVPDEFSTGEEEEYFFGGGLFARYTLNRTFSFYLDYSYLENAAREPVLLEDYTMAEHRLMAGVEIVFGG